MTDLDVSEIRNIEYALRYGSDGMGNEGQEYVEAADLIVQLEREIAHLNERLIAQHEGDLTERESYWAAETLKARAEIIALGGNARGKVYRICVKHETLNSTWPTILVESVPPPCPICEAAMNAEDPK